MAGDLRSQIRREVWSGDRHLGVTEPWGSFHQIHPPCLPSSDWARRKHPCSCSRPAPAFNTKSHLLNLPKDIAPADGPSLGIIKLLLPPASFTSAYKCALFFPMSQKTLPRPPHPSQGATPFHCCPFYGKTPRELWGSWIELSPPTAPQWTGSHQVTNSSGGQRPPSAAFPSHPSGCTFPMALAGASRIYDCPVPSL